MNTGKPRAVIVAGLVELPERAVPIAKSGVNVYWPAGGNVTCLGKRLEAFQSVMSCCRIAGARIGFAQCTQFGDQERPVGQIAEDFDRLVIVALDRVDPAERARYLPIRRIAPQR